MAEVKGWQHIQLVALFPIFTGVSLLSMFAAGWALDKWGTARIMPYYQLPMAVGFVVLGMTESISGATVGLVFLGLTVGANNTLPSAFWAEFYGTRHIGAIKAMAAAVMVLGSAIGPGLTGVLIDLGIPLSIQFLWIGLFFVLVCSLVWVGISPRPSRPLTHPPEIDVIRPVPAVADMSRRDLQHRLRQRWDRQPVRHLIAQNTARGRNRAGLVPILAFAGHDQNQPLALSLRAQTNRISAGCAVSTRIPCRSSLPSGFSLPRFIRPKALVSICTGAMRNASVTEGFRSFGFGFD